jgi:hypothetical protein
MDLSLPFPELEFILVVIFALTSVGVSTSGNLIENSWWEIGRSLLLREMSLLREVSLLRTASSVRVVENG